MKNRRAILCLTGSALILAMLAADGCAQSPIAASPLTQDQNTNRLKQGMRYFAIELLPLRPELHVFEVEEGSRKGQQLIARIVPDGQDRWKYTLQSTRVAFLEGHRDGSISIPREQDLGEAVDITYDPAIPLLPAMLTAGQAVEGSCKMTVRNLKDGSPRDQGTCTYRIELTAFRAVHTPAGDFDANIVEGSRQIRLGLATVDVATLTAYKLHGGTIAESVTQKTLALGLVGGTKREVLKLVK